MSWVPLIRQNNSSFAWLPEVFNLHLHHFFCLYSEWIIYMYMIIYILHITCSMHQYTGFSMAHTYDEMKLITWVKNKYFSWYNFIYCNAVCCIIGGTACNCLWYHLYVGEKKTANNESSHRITIQLQIKKIVSESVYKCKYNNNIYYVIPIT